ncbi:MAG: hypothetical protein LBV74_18690 [Tannerella sp.]|jgi:hypothetical protein|nr:hypothetical protein [Tannerella sp.]
MKRILNKCAFNVVSVLFAGILLISLYSCNNEVERNTLKRNILFYIATDESNIDIDTPAKINQIRAGWKPGSGEMLIYVDRRSDGAYLLRVNTKLGNDGYGLDTLERYGVENSADSEVLSRVINIMTRDYPADSYGMIFFSHGSGWLPEGTLASPRSLVIDNGGGTKREMEYTDFASAIPDGQFDFIILEACLMADVMSIYELRNKAEYILASSAEIVAPGFGGSRGMTTEIYKNEIMRLYDKNSSIKTIVSGFGQSYYNRIASIPENNEYCSATLSLIKTDEMENLASVVKSVLQGVDFDETNLIVNSIQSFDRSNTGTFGWQNRSRYFDLGHTVENLVSDSQYNIFKNQLEKTIVWKASTKRFLLGDNNNGTPDYNTYRGFFINYHSGLTTYIKQDAYPVLNSAYESSSWYKAIH